MVLENIIFRMALILFICSVLLYRVRGEPLVPCMFVFGDSAVDNGNNNFRDTSAKGNYWPYGVDFPAGATGRFSNGRITTDLVSQSLGLPGFTPPFATAFGREILKGVNFASAGARIIEDSTRLLGDVVTFGEQINNFKNVASRMAVILGNQTSAANRLNKCIYFLNIGNNDFSAGSFSNHIITTKNYTIDEYIEVVIQQFFGQLWTLYGYGARKFAIMSLTPTSCIPVALAANSGPTDCPKEKDTTQKNYNKRLKDVVQNFNNQADATFIYINAFGILDDILKHPSFYGFKVTDLACCGAGKNDAQVLCPRFQTPCPNRTEFVYWDSFHTTETVNIQIANRAFHAQKPTDSFPFDIFHLAQI